MSNIIILPVEVTSGPTLFSYAAFSEPWPVGSRVPIHGYLKTPTNETHNPARRQISHSQSFDSFVVLHISGKGQAHTTNGMIDDTIDEEGGICHEFAHPCRIRSLSDGPLQDVGFSNSFQKLVKVLAVGDETGRIQVPSATVTRRVIIPVSSVFLFLKMNP